MSEIEAERRLREEFDALFAGRFKDWPRGCIVQGPFVEVEPFERALMLSLGVGDTEGPGSCPA